MKIINIGNDNKLARKLRSVQATSKTETPEPKADVVVEPVKEEVKDDAIEATQETVQESEQGTGREEATEQPSKQQTARGMAKKGK